MGTAEYIVRIASRLGADIVVLHVYDGSHPAPDARAAFDVFVEAADKTGLGVQSRVQRGPVVETIIAVAEQGDFALIVMGASADVAVEDWVSSRVLHRSQLPVVVVPHLYRRKDG